MTGRGCPSTIASCKGVCPPSRISFFNQYALIYNILMIFYYNLVDYNDLICDLIQNYYAA